MSHDPKPLGGKIISKPVIIFGPLIVLCMLLIVKRLVFGLGSVSDLNGGFPWGVWIAFDLLIGTGFACGGWALAWAVYEDNTIRWYVRRCWRACLATRWVVCQSPSTSVVTGTCRISTFRVTST